MGIRILRSDDDMACLYDSVTDWAFGPVFYNSNDAEGFLKWVPDVPDLRLLTDQQMEAKFIEFCQLKEKIRDDAGGGLAGDLAWQDYLQCELEAI
jgi:hypothetical protein